MEKIREYSNAAGEGEREEQSGLADAETCLEAGVRIQGFECGCIFLGYCERED